MKLLRPLLVCAAPGVMLASAAFADPPSRTDQGHPYNIRIASEVTPVSHGGADYPSYAAMRSMGGSCEVTFDVTADGKAAGVAPACTSDHFIREAARVASDMTFAPKAVSGAKVRIYWTINEPSASLSMARAN